MVQVVEKKLSAWASFVSILMLVACGKSQAVGRPSGQGSIPTPSLAQQIRLAQRAGPGFLNYCLRRNGRVTARYGVDVPGGATIVGWCDTLAVRSPRRDSVTFRAHWDAVRLLGRSGTLTLVYVVSRPRQPLATPTVRLSHQSGESPP